MKKPRDPCPLRPLRHSATVRLLPAAVLLAIAPLAGCRTTHEVKADTTHTVKVEPIHVTVDVNVKVDRELDRFFDFEDEYTGEESES